MRSLKTAIYVRALKGSHHVKNMDEEKTQNSLVDMGARVIFMLCLLFNITKY